MKLPILTVSYTSKWLNVIILKNGWHFVSRRTKGHGHTNRPDAVFIAATTEDERGKHRLLLTQQFRPAIGKWEWSFPAGLLDKGEKEVAAAQRELLEETGYSLTAIQFISPSHPSSAGLTDECSSIVFGEAKFVRGGKLGIQDEKIRLKLVDRKAIHKIIEGHSGPVAARVWPILFQLAATGEFGAGLLQID